MEKQKNEKFENQKRKNGKSEKQKNEGKFTTKTTETVH